MIGFILSINMSSSEHMLAFAELSTKTDDLSESNPTCSDYSTLEDSIWHILYFEIMYKTKDLFLGWPFGGVFLALQLVLLEFGLYLLIMPSCMLKSIFGTLNQLSLALIILYSLCKK